LWFKSAIEFWLNNLLYGQSLLGTNNEEQKTSCTLITDSIN